MIAELSTDTGKTAMLQVARTDSRLLYEYVRGE